MRAGSEWKTKLGMLNTSPHTRPQSPNRPGTSSSAKNDPTQILEASKDDIISLWEDAEVREILAARGVRINEISGL